MSFQVYNGTLVEAAVLAAAVPAAAMEAFTIPAHVVATPSCKP